ncbi:MAG TPA: CaiB/BaiF CoA-transferase family protein [Methylibium sp.]|nr:CaiB/BaiF CoA-transferase family protein [Methylibium sp.]
MGVLDGVRIVEMAGIGPAPFCAMLLADMGADVLRVDRLAASDLGVDTPTQLDLLNRSKRSVAVDLKSEQGLATVKQLVGSADVLIEGFRPGVMEKLGLGPEVCLQLNPRLVFGRMTGWGQNGPLSQTAGHDINYIAITGVLDAIGRRDQPPSIPLNLVGDFAGGSLYLAMGVLAAVIQARSSGHGQVVDAAIVDGVTNLLTMQRAFDQMKVWPQQRGRGFLSGGAPFYDVYETRDERFIAIGSVEPKFYRELITRLGLDGEALPGQNDQRGWDTLRERFAAVFRTRTRAQWCAVFEGSDACFAPVLDMDEAVSHPHNVARELFVEVQGVLNPQPAPRFSRTPSAISRPPAKAGADADEALADWGFTAERVAALRRDRVVG